MPKVISRSTISASNDAEPTASSHAALRIYYCLCGEFALVSDRALEKVPRRTTDGAYVLRNRDAGPGKKARAFKINAVAKGPVVVQREKGLEKQYRLHCSRCDLFLAYETTPPPVRSGPWTYIMPGAVSENQGSIPADALLGEGKDTPPPRTVTAEKQRA